MRTLVAILIRNCIEKTAAEDNTWANSLMKISPSEGVVGRTRMCPSNILSIQNVN
jgi:hypothetical protein